MKILFVASDLARNGQGMQLAQLAAAAKDDGHEVSAISLGEAGAAGAWLAEKGVDVKTLPSNSWRMPLALARLSVATIRMRPDVLQTWGFRANIAGKAVGFFCGARAIVSSLRSPETPKRMEMERITSFLSARMVANSEWLATLAAKCGISKSLLTFVPNCVDAAEIKCKERRRPQGKDAKWKILIAGRRCPEAGTPIAVAALGGLANSGMPFKAVFAGDAVKGFDDELQRHLKDSNLSHKIELKGKLGQEAMRKLMDDSHILIAPNVFGWTPNTILEAFASGLPVVATSVEGVKELVVEGKTGRLAAPMDPSSLAKRVAEAAMEYDSSTRMAREARKLALERHSLQSVRKAYLDLYKSLAQPPVQK